MNESNQSQGARHPYPQVGDEWEFKLPHMKAKRVKTVGSIVKKDFVVEHGIETLPYVHWQRQNKGRYTGISVRRLMDFGHRVSTKAEREAKYAAIAERRKQERDARGRNET